MWYGSLVVTKFRKKLLPPSSGHKWNRVPEDCRLNVQSLENFKYHVNIHPCILSVCVCVCVCTRASFLVNSEIKDFHCYWYKSHVVGRDSSVGIATRYGLDGPGIESRWGWNFPHPSRPALGPIQPPSQCVPPLSPGAKAAGVWSSPPTSI